MNIQHIAMLILVAASMVSGPVNAQDIKSATVIGTRVVDLDGQIHRIGMKETLAPAAIVFLDTGCPIANRYSPEMNQIHADARRRGVEFYGMLSDPLLTLKEAKAFRQKYKLEFPIIWDSNGDMAMRLKPTHFPECFVINKQDQMVYRGRIDNRFAGIGKLRQNITSHELKDAIAAVAKGERPSSASQSPVGCVFESWSEELPEKLTFNQHISPIIYANCTACHREGEVAPFALENFAQTQRRADMCASVCEEKIMPPWAAEPGTGHFKQERFLSERQIELLSQWADGDQLEGKEENKLDLPRFPKGGWALGKPDMVIKMPEPFSVPATGKDIYRYFVISNPLEQDLYLSAMDFQPGNKTVVHHMNSFVDFAGRARKMDAKDDKPGFSVFGTGSFMSYDGSGENNAIALGGWVPGMGPIQAPDRHGIYIPRGGEIVIEIHYNISGQAATDQSSLGFYFCKETPERYVDGTVIGTQNLEIEPGDKDYRRHCWMSIPADIDLVEILPHMHYIGRTAKVEATLPDGKKVPLVNITDWDFRWQSLYTFREPIRLPAGSRIDAWFSFDNSKDNYANPLPNPEKVGWGWGTGDEMAEVWLTYVPVDRANANEIYKAANMTWYRSGDPKDAKPLNVPKTVELLKTESLWTDRGEELLLQIYANGSLKELISGLEQAIGQNPGNAKLQVAKGAVLSTLTWDEKDMVKLTEISTKADAAFDAAIAVDNYHWDAWMTKAAFYAAGGDTSYEAESIKMFQQLVDGQEQYEQQPHQAKAYREYGKLLAKQGKDKKAKQVWQRGLRFHRYNTELKKLIEQ